jgi:hypothetical protein
LWVYDRDKGEYRQQTPKNTALQTHYYSLEDEQGNKDATIETVLAQVEGQAWPIIDKVGERKALSVRARQDLALFLSLLKFRVPDYEKALTEMNDKVFKAINRMMFHSETATRNLLESMEKEQGVEGYSEMAKELTEFVAQEDYSLGTTQQERLQNMLELGLEVARHLERTDWIFMRAPRNTAFVTSDNPFILLAPENHDPKRGFGFLTPGAKKVVPLTAQTCLIAYDEGLGTAYAEVSRRDVRNLNISIAAYCDRFVIGRDEALVRKAVEGARVEEKGWGDRVAVHGGR